MEATLVPVSRPVKGLETGLFGNNTRLLGPGAPPSLLRPAGSPGEVCQSDTINPDEVAMTVKAVYENGVLKPKKPLPLKEHEEVEIEVRRLTEPVEDEEDPRSFVGFIKGAPAGLPVAQDHDEYLDN
jgi:predicted DNA-binding antitoxin AbrB/MazE fold protein